MNRIVLVCALTISGCTFVERSAVFIGRTTRDVVDGAVYAWEAGTNAFSEGGSDDPEPRAERPSHPGAIEPAPSARKQEDDEDKSQTPANPRLPEVRDD